MEGAEARVKARRQRAYDFFNQGQQWLQAKERGKALAALARATELDPDNASYHLAYAEALRPAARPEEVAAALAQAGRAYLHKALYERAVEVLTEAVTLNLRHLAAREWLIQAYQSLGQATEAERQRRALQWIRMKLSGIGASRNFWGRERRQPLAWRGQQVGRTFYEPSLRLSLNLPSGWTVARTDDPATLRLECPGRTGCALLSLEPAIPDQPLKAFAAERFAGLIRQNEAIREVRLHGLSALEVDYQENVGGTLMRTRCLMVRYGTQMVLLSRVAEANRFAEASQDFAALQQGLRLGTLQPGLPDQGQGEEILPDEDMEIRNSMDRFGSVGFGGGMRRQFHHGPFPERVFLL
jgi:tetratricopeptide (TPR) repeat protein